MSSSRVDLLRRQAPPMPPPLTLEEIAYDNSPEILAITGSFFATAALVVLLRCYVRMSMLRVFGIDDWIMLVAMLLCTATFICFVLRVHYGLGHHMLALFMGDLTNFVNLTKVQYIQAITMMVGISAVKISIALTLLRLSVQRIYNRILWTAIAFLVLLTIACAGTLVFQCLPLRAAWDGNLRPPPFRTGTARCYSMDTFRNLGLMNSAFNIATDVLFAALPAPLIWQLQLNIRTKVSLIIILSLGWFACAAGIIKAVKQWYVLTELDWTVSDSFNVWNYIEFCVGAIAASLPTLKPLFKDILDTARGLTSGTRSRGGSYRVKGSKSSLGYSKTSDAWNKEIALDSYRGGCYEASSPTSSKAPYHVRITAQPTALADKEEWEASRKESHEGVWPLRPHHALGSNGIVRTREITIV